MGIVVFFFMGIYCLSSLGHCLFHGYWLLQGIVLFSFQYFSVCAICVQNFMILIPDFSALVVLVWWRINTSEISERNTHPKSLKQVETLRHVKDLRIFWTGVCLSVCLCSSSSISRWTRPIAVIVDRFGMLLFCFQDKEIEGVPITPELVSEVQKAEMQEGKDTGKGSVAARLQAAAAYNVQEHAVLPVGKASLGTAREVRTSKEEKRETLKYVAHEKLNLPTDSYSFFSLRIKLNPLNIKPRNSWWKFLKRFMFCTDRAVCV